MGEIDSLRQILGYTRAFRQMLDRKREVDLRRRLMEREHALSVAPFAPPLPIQRTLSSPGHFTFGLPPGFEAPDAEVLQGWRRGFDSDPLAAAIDRSATEVTCFLAVFSGASEVALSDLGLEGHSLWVLEVLADEYRERARQAGQAVVVAGPKAILVDGERGIWTVTAQVEGGVATRKWGVAVARDGRGYNIMMFVQPHVEAYYASAYWTAVASWRWWTRVSTGPVPPAPPTRSS